MARGGIRRTLQKLGNALSDLVFPSAPSPSPKPAPRPRPAPRAPVPTPGRPDEIPYPRSWSEADKRFWNANIPRSMYRDFGDDKEWHDAQMAFQYGYMSPNSSLEQVKVYRREFHTITGMPERMFNWSAFKEWYASTH